MGTGLLRHYLLMLILFSLMKVKGFLCGALRTLLVENMQTMFG
jgi:hypothetical protein